MPRYVIAEGRQILTPRGVLIAGDSADTLSPADIALFLESGVIEAGEGAADTPEPPQASAPVEVDSDSAAPAAPDAPSEPAVSPQADAGAAPEFTIPDRWPSIRKMPAFLEGKSAAEVRFLQANDGRVSPASEKVYTDALAALEVV